jgi:hypothetical protein
MGTLAPAAMDQRGAGNVQNGAAGGRTSAGPGRWSRTSMDPHKILVGWREWVALPDLRIRHVKAKLDTGARTSALHAFLSERYTERGAPWVRLHVHPRQRDVRTTIVVDAPIVDERTVSDSSGNRERRIVIVSTLALGAGRWPIEISITNRDSLRFRMLLGRTAISSHLIVDPERSYVLGKPRTRRRVPPEPDR